MHPTEFDYSSSGLTLQQAMVAHAKRHPDTKNRPETILWGQHRVRTSDLIHVPSKGVVRLEFLTSSPSIRQGVDLKVNGWIDLPGGEHVSLLRTWQNELLEDVVEYAFFSKDGILRTWNVYEMTYAGGKKSKRNGRRMLAFGWKQMVRMSGPTIAVMEWQRNQISIRSSTSWQLIRSSG